LTSLNQDPTGKAKSLDLDRIEIVMEGQSSGYAFVHRNILRGPDNLSVSLEYKVGRHQRSSCRLWHIEYPPSSHAIFAGLTSSMHTSAQTLYDWEVTLYTSPDSEPFDGSVSMTLTDGAASDPKIKLDIVTPDPNAPAGGASFMPGGKVVCRLKGATIGAPTKATLASVREAEGCLWET
jgi:hypothetical protein